MSLVYSDCPVASSYHLLKGLRSFMKGFLGGAMVKNSPTSAEDGRDAGSMPESERSPGGGNDNLLHYFCLENSMDRGAWKATVHGIAESDMNE